MFGGLKAIKTEDSNLKLYILKDLGFGGFAWLSLNHKPYLNPQKYVE